MWSVVLGTKADSLGDQCKHNRLLRGEETEARALDIIRAPTCVCVDAAPDPMGGEKDC